MVHLLCNIKMLAISPKLNLTRYDIDGFISQVLKSQKFDELSEKLAEKAANKILSIQAVPGTIKKINSNHGDSITDNTHQKKSIDGNVRKDRDKKIDLKAVIMDDTNLPSENLQLNYKFLTKQAVMKANQDLDEDPSEANGRTDIKNKKFESYGNKSIARTSFQEETDKKELNGKNMRFNDNRTHVDKDLGLKGNSDMHSSAYEDTHEKSKNHRLKKHGPGSANINSNESGPEFKDILKQGTTKVSNVRNKANIRKFLTPSEEKGEAGRAWRRETESEEDKHSGGQRIHEESVDYNKVTSDSVYNPYGHSRSSSSETGSRSVRRDRSPEERTREQSDGDNKFRSVVKREGDKLYRYVEAPEYKDYHEDRLKWRKVHSENPVDFM